MGRSTFILLALAGATFVLVTLPRIPPRVAIHFGIDGAANGWSSATGYLLFLGAFGFLLPIAVVLFVARLGASRPELLNVPGKEYWFHPDRRSEGVALLTDRMWWMGCLLLAFTVALHALLLVANARTPARLPNGPFLALFFGFLIGVGLWIWKLHAAMRPPADTR